MKQDKAFTLIEVLLVLTLMGLVFSVLLIIFSRAVESSLNVYRNSQELKSKAVLFWDLERKVFGARRIKIEPGAIYLITSAGSFNKGIVKSAYIFREGELYYYEFPYPYGAIDEVEEDRLMKVGNFSGFEVTAWEGGREFRFFEGLPELVKVKIGEEEFVFEVLR